MSVDESFATKAIHAGQDPLQWSHWEVVPPIVTSTTFRQDGPGVTRGYDYGRSGNPTRNVLETCLASLENAKYALTFSSGLGATTVITSLLNAGDHIISGDDIYGGTNRFFQKCLCRQSNTITFVDMSDISNIISNIKSNTKMIWLETPTNPLLKVIDIQAVAQAAKQKNPETIIVVDNTFLTSYFQKPLNLGADIVHYSVTKYVNGHSDVIMGAIVTNRNDLWERLAFLQNAMGIVPSPIDCFLVNRSIKTLEIRMRQHMENGLAVAQFLESHPCVEKKPLNLGADIVHYSVTKYVNGHSDVIMGAIVTNRNDLWERLAFLQNAMGIVPSPIDCFLVNRGIKTLEIRMRQHMENGLAVARFLESHPCVEKVFHPYLPSHPHHEIALKQASGHSGMVTFYLKGDSNKFLNGLKVFTVAESLGGYESLAELPSVMTHASVPEEDKKKLGINDQLIRLSVGLESKQDLLADLDQALKAELYRNLALFSLSYSCARLYNNTPIITKDVPIADKPVTGLLNSKTESQIKDALFAVLTTL
ncbi:unnamed protein product, partial [Heterotrigona itama]